MVKYRLTYQEYFFCVSSLMSASSYHYLCDKHKKTHWIEAVDDVDAKKKADGFIKDSVALNEKKTGYPQPHKLIELVRVIH